MPRRFAPFRGDPDADTFPYSQAETSAASQTYRPGKALTERVAHAFRKTGSLAPAKILSFAVILWVARCVFLAGFLCFSCIIPETVANKKRTCA